MGEMPHPAVAYALLQSVIKQTQQTARCIDAIDRTYLDSASEAAHKPQLHARCPAPCPPCAHVAAGRRGYQKVTYCHRTCQVLSQRKHKEGGTRRTADCSPLQLRRPKRDPVVIKGRRQGLQFATAGRRKTSGGGADEGDRGVDLDSLGE